MSCRGIALALEQIAPIVAGTTTKVKLSGHALWNEPTDDLTIPYTLSIYVQNADVDPRCEQSKGSQLQKAINIPTLGRPRRSRTSSSTTTSA